METKPGLTTPENVFSDKRILFPQLFPPDSHRVYLDVLCFFPFLIPF